MTKTNEEAVRATVREHYTKVAESNGAVGCAPGCCSVTAPGASLALGYTEADLAAVPEGANMGLGCGNPQLIAALKPGETVVDLGSGGGFDCFLAAKQVSASGRVIGVDMTAEMVTKARANAEKLKTTNVEFRLGEIEHLPLENDTVDVVISNCVVNLSPDKGAVYREVFRVLKPGGRVAISDVVALKPIPEALLNDALALSGCVAGAALVEDIESILAEAGFEDGQVHVNGKSRDVVAQWLPGTHAEDYVASATVMATKPKSDSCCEPTCCS